ncbi:MAG: ABC transporter substrate-binding protein [Acetobacteraceae bacterium]|nr:ABC transporter substrate-binding protein [Acetobacteraceae bacterium]
MKTPATTTRRHSLALMASGLMTALSDPAIAAPSGTLTIAVHVSIAPIWFDPSESGGVITSYLFAYGLHDALVKPMPEGHETPCLAASHTVSADNLTHEFVLREGTTFHNGDPITVEDVKFSFERYHGYAAKLVHDGVASVETPDSRRIIFRLKETWPDFMTFLVATTGASWVLPRKYIEKVGDAGFRKAPIGAGPFKFVSFEPGVELVLEAHESYWRRPPKVKRIVMKVIPDESGRLIALKRGEVDFAYSIRGELGAEARRTPGLKLEVARDGATYWMYFPEQWDPKSPWSNPKVRRAAALALDYESINAALNLGYSRITSNIVPRHLPFYWQSPPPVHDPAQAMKLLAEAGFPAGFDGGFYWCDGAYANLGEAAVNNLTAVGIRMQLRPLERVAYNKGFEEKRFKKGIIQAASAAFGNASTRIAIWALSDGPYAYGGYPEIDALFARQLHEVDIEKRGAILREIQQFIYVKDMFVPLWQLGFLCASGPRLANSAFDRIPGFVFMAPFEDIALNPA